MRRYLVLLVTVLVGGAIATACSSPTPSGPSPSSTSAGTTASPSANPSASPTAPASPTAASTWTSSPVVVTRNVPVPPVPRLLAIRPGSHPEAGYDRITFDFVATLPGYDIRYVAQPVMEGSGQPASVPGRRFLQVVFRPAQAHDDSGTPVTPRTARLDYPMMRGYTITGDFEGVLTVVIGLDDVVGFRVGELPGTPGRIYVDVAA